MPQLIFDGPQAMSNAAIAFSIYFVIGLVLMIVLLVARVKERGVSGLDAFGGGGDLIDAWLLILAAILWPVWIVVWLAKKNRKSVLKPQKNEPMQPPQRNVGSRPAADDAPASETSSSLGPRC